MAYIKESLPKPSYSKFILQDNGIEFKNEQLMTGFDTLGIKRIYSNPTTLEAIVGSRMFTTS